MRPLLAPEILKIWEQGQGKAPYQKAMLILSAACSDETLEALEKLSIGGRDARLLTLREWSFGPELASITACPACGERLEFSLNVADIRILEPDRNSPLHHLDVEDFTIEFRLPNTGDLKMAEQCQELEQIQSLMAKRCVCSASQKGHPITPDDLPPEVVEALASQIVERDPQADSRLSLSCPACNHHWQAIFDIVSYFWTELEAWATRLLREVHILASAYGWHEADILAMSPLRRRLYMEMVGQ
jgi:hypothetical protein